MKKDDIELSLGLTTRNSNNEMKNLNSCILKYFNGNSESQQLKEQESTILSALAIYFNGHEKVSLT